MIRIRTQCRKCALDVVVPADDGQQGKVPCPRCGAHLLEIESIAGVVYVLSNASMPGLLKIGFTTRSVDERIAEISGATGVPEPFVCEAYWLSVCPDLDEKKLHHLFASERVRGGREFFRLAPRVAIDRISEFLDTRPEGEVMAAPKDEPSSTLSPRTEDSREELKRTCYAPVSGRDSPVDGASRHLGGFGSDRYRNYEKERG